MKGRLIVATLGAIVLVANQASAGPRSHHRASPPMHARQMPPAFARTYGYVLRPASQGRSLGERYNHIYESESLGHQSFPNPDRVLPVPDHYE